MCACIGTRLVRSSTGLELRLLEEREEVEQGTSIRNETFLHAGRKKAENGNPKLRCNDAWGRRERVLGFPFPAIIRSFSTRVKQPSCHQKDCPERGGFAAQRKTVNCGRK